MARIEQLDRARNCLCFPRVTRSGVGCAQRVGSLAIPCMTVLTATLTCPHCGHKRTETMPTNACVHVYECSACRAVLRPKPGDCCIFCSYGSSRCPPRQTEDA